MNYPMLNYRGAATQLHGNAANDGRTAMRNTEQAFWQSRMTRSGSRAEPFCVVDIPELARAVRVSFNPNSVL